MRQAQFSVRSSLPLLYVWLACYLMLLVLLPRSATAAPQLTVTFFDVWQGDSVWIHTPGGQDILIDGGPPEAGSVVVEQLRRQGVKALDLLVISHPHADHFGGLLAVVRGLPVKLVWDSGQPTSSRSYLKLLQELDMQRSAHLELARAGQVKDLGNGVRVEVLAPADPLLKDTHSDPNNNSIVLRLTFGQVRFLFTGDIEADAVDALLERARGSLQAQILKIPHHGSRYTTPEEFLAAVRPEAAVISCGRGNGYGHPHRETLQRLQAHGLQIWRTDEKGTVQITTDGQTYRISSLPTPSAVQARLRPPGSSISPGSAAIVNRARVNLNTATLDELAAVPGIGKALGQRIIDGRPYSSVDDLLAIKGFTKSRLEPIRPRLTVQ